jgi:hypothetical protein
MKPPIFAVDRGGEVSVFVTKEVAENYLEINDVDDDEHTFYDAEGRLLNGRPHPARNAVILEDAEPEPTHAGSLRQALLAALPRWRSAPQDLGSWELAALVDLARKYAIGPPR